MEGAPNAPVLSKTKLGWILHGNVPFTQKVDAQFTFFTCCDSSDTSLHELVKQSFTAENFGLKLPTKVLLGKNEERAMNILRATTEFVGDSYEAGHLWRDDSVSVPPSRSMAMKRLLSMEKKMDLKKIDEYVEKGYAVNLVKQLMWTSKLDRPYGFSLILP